MTIFRRAALAAAPILFGPAHALAAAPDLGVPENAIETITVVGAKVERSLAEVANTISVIDAERIQRELSSDIKDLVRYEPGVSVNSDAARFGVGSFNIRGIEGNRVAIEVDGVPVLKGFAIGHFSNTGRTPVDLALLKRVELLRGPASALYGSDALAGVVAFSTRDPADLLAGTDYHLGLRSGYTSVDDGFNVALTAAAQFGPVGGLVGYVRRRGDERDNAATSPNPQHYQSDSMLAKLVHETQGGVRNTLLLDASAIDATTDVRSLIHGPDRYATTTSLIGDDRDRRYRASFEQRLGRLGRYAEQLIWRGYWQESNVTQRTTQLVEATPPRTPHPTERWREFDYRQRVAGGEITLESLLSLGSWTHRLVYGAEATYSTIAEYRDGRLTNLTTGATSNNILGETFPRRDFPVSSTLELGVYAQDEIDIGERLTLLPAVRYERYHLEPEADPIFRAGDPTTVITALTHTSLSPKLGMLFQPNERHTLYAQYARGFRSPPFSDVNIGFTIPQLGYTALPNPALRPEQSQGYELGWRWRAGGSDLGIAAYHNRYRNFIESRVNLGVDPVTRQTTFQSQNRARATIQGVEVRSSLWLADVAPQFEGWRFNASAAWQHGQDTARDLPLNSIDPAKLILGVEYAPTSGRWGTELITTLVAAKSPHRIDASNGAMFAPRGYGSVDLLGHFDLRQRLRIDWSIQNLLNRTYWEWADTRGVLAGDPNIPLHARPGRTIAVSLNLALR
ncbi:MAG: TonB-dependent hemoglobin/transferrin/lactoferrin family receptor [Gammaproteobacteria bacterium]|nr:TonB-dependent hemoglobin/transferrin/lactoferrin family receptor [Gammaproteobacteria bacterium]